MGCVAVIATVLVIGTPMVRWLAAQDDFAVLLPIIVTVVVVIPGLVIGLGIQPLRSDCTKGATRAEVLSHAIGLAGLVIVVYGVISPSVRIFREYEVLLPALTQNVVAINHAAMQHVELVLPLVVSLVFVDIVVFAPLHAATARRPWARLWSAGITLLLLTAMVVLFVAVLSPLFVVSQRLSS